MNVNACILKCQMSGNSELAAFAAALSCYPVIECSSIPTAGTDGVIILVNPDFMEPLTFEETCGVLLHEILHNRLDHHARMAGNSATNHPMAANMSMDDEINPIVENADGFALPADGEWCHPRQIGMDIGLNWEAYYGARLESIEEPEDDADDSEDGAEKPEQDGADGQSGNGDPTNGESEDGESGDGESDGENSDDADSEDGGSGGAGGAESDEESDGESDGENGEGAETPTDLSTGDQPNNADPTCADIDGGGEGQADSGDFLRDGVHETGTLAEKYAPETIGDDAQETAAKNSRMADSQLKDTDLRNEIAYSRADDAPTEGGKRRTTRDGEMICPTDDETWMDCVIRTVRKGDNWRTDWSIKDRRVKNGSRTYRPSRRRVDGQHIALVVDVSISCEEFLPLWTQLANQLVEECREITRLSIIYHTHRVHEVAEWRSGEVYINENYSGGTDHREALEVAEETGADTILMFTDCETYWPTEAPECNVVTVIPKLQYDCDYVCPYGVNIQLSAKDCQIPTA
jgi:predicted metal-dependent peptidase